MFNAEADGVGAYVNVTMDTRLFAISSDLSRGGSVASGGAHCAGLHRLRCVCRPNCALSQSATRSVSNLPSLGCTLSQRSVVGIRHGPVVAQVASQEALQSEAEKFIEQLESGENVGSQESGQDLVAKAVTLREQLAVLEEQVSHGPSS